MKMKSMSSWFCAVAIFGTASVAMAGAYGEAEQAEEQPRPAPAVAEVAQSQEFAPFAYLAVGGLYGQEFFFGDARQINQTYGWGVNGRVGYRFMPMLAAELLFEDTIEYDADAGRVDPSISHPGLRTANIDRSTWLLEPNLKFFPIQGFCEPFLSLGGGLFHANNGHNNQVEFNPAGHQNPTNLQNGGVNDGYGFAFRFGLGADFYATEHIFIEPEVAYNLPVTSNTDNYRNLSVSLGIGYAFN
ncbi:MAG TPA: outer membrane beta-barrel protein [Candidatus Binatia bacterium]|jgi:opacity protein-like surface antigen